MRLVAEGFTLRQDIDFEGAIKWLQPPDGLVDPAAQGRAVDLDPLTAHHLGLPVERQMPAELVDGQGDEHGFGDHAALHGARRRRGLGHRAVAFGAVADLDGVARASVAQHLVFHRRNVHHFGDVVADEAKLCSGLEKLLLVFRLDKDIDARQMLRQIALIAPSLVAGLLDDVFFVWLFLLWLLILGVLLRRSAFGSRLLARLRPAAAFSISSSSSRSWAGSSFSERRPNITRLNCERMLWSLSSSVEPRQARA